MFVIPNFVIERSSSENQPTQEQKYEQLLASGLVQECITLLCIVTTCPWCKGLVLRLLVLRPLAPLAQGSECVPLCPRLRELEIEIVEITIPTELLVACTCALKWELPSIPSLTVCFPCPLGYAGWSPLCTSLTDWFPSSPLLHRLLLSFIDSSLCPPYRQLPMPLSLTYCFFDTPSLSHSPLSYCPFVTQTVPYDFLSHTASTSTPLPMPSILSHYFPVSFGLLAHWDFCFFPALIIERVQGGIERTVSQFPLC